MKSIKEMINEIDVNSLEKTILLLNNLSKIHKENEKYNCETCRHEISSICLDCDPKNKSKGWEPKEPEKSIEEQVFELIKNNLGFEDIWKNKDLSFESFEQMILLGYEGLRIHFFLTIMKGVHRLIEGKNFCFKTGKSYYYLVLPKKLDDCCYKIFVLDSVIITPYFFAFSTDKNAEKAENILSKFFGINILDWWYKQ